PLIGATVMEKGTNNGAQTDVNGDFALTVADGNATLIVSYLGYKTQEIALANRSRIDLQLEPGLAELNEIVVVGYGTANKEDVTGAITSVGGEDVNVTKESNALSALAGKAAGVDVSFTTNAPGTSPSILIRGRSSLDFSNQPLIVVDGIPVSSGLADFNPNDIASIDVLKDASAAAVYGARGANGVILITTKRGRVGKAQVSYDGYYGYAEPFERVQMMNAQQWADLRLEALRTDAERRGNPAPTLEEGLTSQELEALNAGVDTDWQDFLFQNGKQQSHQLGVSGGTEKTRYNISLNYFEQEGIIAGSEFERLTLRTNLDFNITDKFQVGLSQQIAFSDRENRRHGGLINASFQSLPVLRAFEDDGVTPTTDPLGDGNYWNPLNDLVEGNYIDNDRFFNYFANIFASYRITDNLKYRINIGPELRFQRSNDFRGSLSTTGRGGQNRASKFNQARTSYTIENLLYYDKTFNDSHKFGATLLFSVQEIQNEQNNISVRDIPSETQTFNNLGVAAPENRNVSSSLDKERWTSTMARFNYSFQDKYLIELVGRYDGSSKLAAGNKWGFFPSGSLGWRINREGFLLNSKVINNLKLNFGYGTVGRNPISPYTTQGNLFRTEGSFGDQPAFGFRPGTIANPDLKWEITTTTNVGLDFSLFDYRISGNVNYYVGQTSDLLLSSRLPITSGFGNITRNVGQTENRGIELELETVNIQTDDFSWTTSFNFARNRSKIVQLLDRENDDIGNRWFIGEQLAVHYDRVFAGIWQADEADEANSFGREVGQVKIEDLNGDGNINDDDRRIVGFVDPQWIGGFTSTVRFKGLDFTVAALTRQGHTIRQRALFANNSLVGRNNNVVVDYWTLENPSNSFPRPDANRQGPRDEGVINYYDGSYIRIRNIALGYDFSGLALERLKLQKLRVYVTAQNPFLFRADDRLIDGVDPDVAGNGSEWLPSPRTFLFGLNVTL
ncbi:MAG: TonB-dependent receptor, partial [Bacteroidota bacterium]